MSLNTATPAADGPDPVALVTASVAAVRQLLAAGLLDPAALGLSASGPPPAPRPVLVPGERIRLADLAVKTRRRLAPGTLRTYGTYLTLLVDGAPATNA